MRTLAALLLAQLMLLGLVPAGARAAQGAEGDETPVPESKGQWVVDEESSVFIIQQDEDATTCRVALPEEARRLRGGDESIELRQINHLERFDANGAAQAGGVITQNAASGLTIILRATPQLEQNQTAKNAFIAAAAKWEAQIKDPITVVIDVDFGTTAFGVPFPSANTLGVTSAQGFLVNYNSVRNSLITHAFTQEESSLFNQLPTSGMPTNIGTATQVIMQSAQMRALGFMSATPGAGEQAEPPKIAFNSAFGFDFSPPQITSNQTDFDAVAVHEIGHALGFDSEVGAREISPTRPLLVSLWDIFRFRPGTGQGFTHAQRILTTGGEQVYFDGGSELRLSTGNPEGEGGDGNQSSHWKDDAQTGGALVGIMDPNIPRGRRMELTANDIRAVNFFGYQTGAGPAAPANDNFGGAQAISGAAGTVTGSNSGATRESGEPSHEPGGNPGGRSVWYAWTAPGTGTATFDTVGSTFDTLLAAYTGTSVTALTQRTSNDDIASGNTQSRIQFAAQAGTTYFIAVDGFNGGIGNITLNWTAPSAPVGGPNTVQFQNPIHGGGENLSSLLINVTRTGDLSGAASVKYSTQNGTASDRSDYMAAVGTLRFAPHESSKQLNIILVNDLFVESDESFTINLSEPSGCTLGSTPTTSVRITSDDATTGQSPVKWSQSFNAEFFVAQHYRDFFNREPDASGLAFWTNQITECGANTTCLEARRVNVSAAFFLSGEFQQTGYLVYLTHQAAFNTGEQLPFRTFLADTHQIGRGVVFGAPGAEQLLEANTQAFFDEFVTRPSFVAAYPASLNTTQYVNALANNAGSSISQDELNALAASGRTRAQILRAIAEDADFRSLYFNRAFVLMQYFGYLRRAPNESPNIDFSGYHFWLGKLNEQNGNFVSAEMVKSFLISGEYVERFGQ